MNREPVVSSGGLSFVIEKRIGGNAQTAVYLCRHVAEPDLRLVVKVFHTEQCACQETMQRFENEMFIARQVISPRVIRVLDHFASEDMVGYSMEYAPNGTLAALIEREGTVPVARAIFFLRQIAFALTVIHGAGIVHRDLKLDNVFLFPEDRVKVGDFGISLMKDARRITAVNGLVGSIPYMSPEYLEHGYVDQRSDIYSFGILAYRLIAGVMPFIEGLGVMERMKCQISTDPLKPEILNSECPQELSAIIMKALSRDPRRRYQRAAELLAALNAPMTKTLLHNNPICWTEGD